MIGQKSYKHIVIDVMQLIPFCFRFNNSLTILFTLLLLLIAGMTHHILLQIHQTLLFYRHTKIINGLFNTTLKIIFNS